MERIKKLDTKTYRKSYWLVQRVLNYNTSLQKLSLQDTRDMAAEYEPYLTGGVNTRNAPERQVRAVLRDFYRRAVAYVREFQEAETQLLRELRDSTFDNGNTLEHKVSGRQTVMPFGDKIDYAPCDCTSGFSY